MSSIQSVSREERIFEPQQGFVAKAGIASLAQYQAEYQKSIESPDSYWLKRAQELHWFNSPTQGLDRSKFPFVTWFADGTTNLSFNCLDRQIAEGRGDKVAILFEGEPGDQQQLTYQALTDKVARFASVLVSLGVAQGDRVAIYMGMVPEAVIAMQACARIGAIHTVIFGGFAADAVRDRVNDAGAKVIVTQDGAWRRGAVVPLKANVDQAVLQCPSVEKVITYRRIGAELCSVDITAKDLDWDEQLSKVAVPTEAAVLPAESPLFILYTSGTTGKPKGVLHTTGGYMVGAYATSQAVFDLKEEDVYWCTADVGWVTGHSYVAYGPLLNGATVLMYEGAPNQPDPSRFWRIIERYRVSILYTAPTAIRAFIKWGDQYPASCDLSSLRLLGTVGEPINPEAWMWYRKVIGGDRCPIVDTWWQTETGGVMMSPLPGAISTKPGSCTLPFFGITPSVIKEDGSETAANEGGYLVIKEPWPSMMRTIWGDDARFVEQYFSKFKGLYFTGDGARRDQDGYFWVMGRVDDVVNVAGHRLGTAEIESALVAHPAVAEAAAVGRPDELKGQALVGFVTLKHGVTPSPELKADLLDYVAKEIGKFARPDDIRFTESLPKTRSGKIMRRLLKDVAAGKQTVGDVTTLEDHAVLAALYQEE